MFANPEVSTFIDRLIGGQTPRGGTPPQSQGSRTDLARALLGDITKPAIRGGFTAPAIRPGRGLEPSLPSEGVGRSSGSGAPGQSEFRGSAGNTGASGLASGIGKLGAGIESGIEGIAAKNQAAAEIAALRPGGAPTFGGGVVNTAPNSGGSSSAGTPPVFAQSGVGPSGGTGSYESPNSGLFQQLVSAYQGHGWPLQAAVNIASVQLRGEGAGLGSGGADAAFGGSNGLSQWSADRWNRGVNWMKANGYDPRSVEGQTAWTTQELRTTYKNVDPNSVASLVNNYESPRSDLRAGEIARSQNFAASHGLGAADVAQDREQDAADAQRPSASGASTTSPTGVGGGPVQSGIYGNQPYTFQTRPALGQQGSLETPQMQQVAENGEPLWPQQGETFDQFQFRQLQNQPGGVQPGTPPDSLPGMPRQYADLSANPLALALAGGQMPPIDPNFGGSGSGLFG